MFVVVLFALLSLAAAQCGNSCNCGNSACCQNSYDYGSPYNIFNLGYNQYGVSPAYGNDQQYSSSVGQLSFRSSCLKVASVPYTTTQVYQNQPVFIRIVEDTPDNRQIDNFCTTLFPVPDDSSTYIEYDSIVYCDGSSSITTSIVQDAGVGTYSRGNAYGSATQRVFASLGNDLFIGCSRIDYGETSILKVFVTQLGGVSSLGGSCIQQIQNIIQCVGQQEDGLFVLPYNLPTRCVTQQVCSLVNPLLYAPSYNGYYNGIC